MMPKLRNTPKMKRPRPHLANCAPSFMARLLDAQSLNFFDVARLPALIDCRFGRTVEAQDREITFPRYRRQPVTRFSIRCFRSEIKINRAIGVLCWLITRAERRERLTVGKTRCVFGLVQCDRPKVGGGDVGRQF